MEEQIQMTVLIAGRAYPLKIAKADQTLVHQLVREVNEKLTVFQAQYQNKDKQDCLAMVLLTYAMEAQKGSQEKKDNQEAKGRLNQIDALLDDILKQ